MRRWNLRILKSVPCQPAPASMIKRCPGMLHRDVSGSQPLDSSNPMQQFVLPPVNEQLEIINHLKTINSEFKRVIDITSDELERINDFRQTVISQAVTGKIKV